MAKLKILVVDDEPGIRGGVERILRNFKVDYPFMDEQFEFQVFQAATGEEGLELIDQEKPDIVLLDNKLPGIQGVEVLATIKKRRLDMVVVMITSFASLDLAVKATSDGAYDFIPKPFTPQELKGSIESITKHVFLVRMTKKLDHAGKQIRFQFLSVLSHELKAPLNAIEGYLKMVREKEFGDKLEEYFPIVDRSLDRVKGMRNLILDLLDLTKLETGKTHRDIKEVNLAEVARTAIDTMQPYAIQRDVAVNLHAPESILMIADNEEMEIVFNNLISNAIKYNKDKGRVDVTIARKGDIITIIVTDTGIGMSKTEMAGLFQDFVRIRNEKTKSISGSGLGLSIVKKLVESYAGEVNVCSQPDQGTSFTVTLPATPPLTQVAIQQLKQES